MGATVNIVWRCPVCSESLSLEATITQSWTNSKLDTTLEMMTTRAGSDAAYGHMADKHPEVAA